MRPILALVMLVLFLTPAHSANILDVLRTQRQEQLYYEMATLPVAVTTLIAQDILVPDTIAYYSHSKDELIRFNIVLILDKKVRAGQLKAPDRAIALAFFEKCLDHANPWIKTEAVFALGNAQGAPALPAIVKLFDDDSATVVYHAVISYRLITKRLPDLTPRQMARFQVAQAASATGNVGMNKLAEAEMAKYLSAEAY